MVTIEDIMSKETDKPADELLEAIKQWSERIEGKVLSSKELLSRATAVIKKRINQ